MFLEISVYLATIDTCAPVDSGSSRLEDILRGFVKALEMTAVNMFNVSRIVKAAAFVLIALQIFSGTQRRTQLRQSKSGSTRVHDCD